jgi:serine O-acetyltransferase
MLLPSQCWGDLERLGERVDFITFIRCYFAHRGFRAVVYYRLSRYLMMKGFRFLPSMIKARSISITGAEIAFEAEIGPGLVITHPVGVVVGSRVRIGKNCTLMQGVTIGEKWSEISGKRVPVVGDEVIIGTGSKILGGVTVGDKVFVGANSVVIGDVPAGKVVAGIPARILVKKELDERG